MYEKLGQILRACAWIVDAGTEYKEWDEISQKERENWIEMARLFENGLESKGYYIHKSANPYE